MVNNQICLRCVHSGKFMVGINGKTEYVGGKTIVLKSKLDVDLLSFSNIRSFLKDMGYARVNFVYYRPNMHDEFVLLNDEFGVMTFVNDLKDGDTFDVFIDHSNPLIHDAHNDVEEVNNECEVGELSKIDGQGNDIAKMAEAAMDDGVEMDSHEGLHEPHTNTDDFLFDTSFLTDDEDDELQAARQKVIDFRKKIASPKNKVDSNVDINELEEIEVVQNDELPNTDESESEHASDYFSSDEDGSYYSESDEEVKDDALRRHSSSIKFDPSTIVPIFCVGMIFHNVEQFKHAVRTYALRKTLGVHFVKNEKNRVRAECLKNCPWVLMASNESKKDDTFKVKTYKPHHRCKTMKKSVFANSSYFSKHYKSIVQLKPNIKIRELMHLIRFDFKLVVSMTVCKLTRQKIREEIIGDVEREFALLNCYANEIRTTSPGTSCQIEVIRDNNGGKARFDRFYVCFNACKMGWKAGCRPIIGLDGCFLKGLCKGQLLCAVGRDGNNQMFPIAWAVVSVENKKNWAWFLKWLQTDLQLETGKDLTLISDMQKGLEIAIEEIFPECEHRMCARHVYAAWAKKWRGEERKIAFWSCAKSTNHPELMQNLDELKKLGEGILDDILNHSNRPIATWCKRFFKTTPQCDVVDNNLSETFNGWILEARCKSIITMLDEIRILVMRRIGIKSQQCNNWIDDVSERAMKKLEKNHVLSFKWQIEFNGDKGYELTHIEKSNLRHVVNLRKKTCSCREWDLTGIPCQHAIAAIVEAHKETKDFISHWYHKEMYCKAYHFKIEPMRGMDLWDTNGFEEILPPPFRKLPGRPKKARRKDKDEQTKTGKLSRRDRIMSCTVCQAENHNARTCPLRKTPIVPTKSNLKRKQKRLAAQQQKASQSANKNKEKSIHAQENAKRMEELVNTYGSKPTKRTRKEKNVTSQSQVISR